MKADGDVVRLSDVSSLRNKDTENSAQPPAGLTRCIQVTTRHQVDSNLYGKLRKGPMGVF